MYLQVFFLLFTCVNIITSKDTDSGEAKYIDLLPEEEKQEFLHKIALRILAEIKSRNRSDRTSVEITDERLDEHDAYVQRIMEEETEKFKHMRRLGSHGIGDDVENDDSESKGKHIEKDNVLDQDRSDTDLSLLKSNIRIKKDTNEETKQTSIESRRINSEDTFTEIPVPLIYDEESNSHPIVTAETVFDNDEPVSEYSVEKNLKVEGLSNRSDKQYENPEAFENRNDTSDFHFQNEDNSKEITDIHNSENNKQTHTYVNSDEIKTEATSDIPRTLIDYFDPEEKSKEFKINITPKDIIIQGKSKNLESDTTEKILDISNGKSFLLDIKSTENIISTTPKSNKESVSPAEMHDPLKISQKYITYASRPILRSEVNTYEPNIENDSVNETEKFDENSTSTDSIHNDGDDIVSTTSYIVQENTSNDTTEIVQRNGNSKENRSDLKQSLRYAQPKHLLPAWKGGFSDISFNPNDYLDLDYYLGRNNDVPDTDDDDFHETSQSFVSQQLRQGKSEDVVDPDASLEHHNIKDKIAALRNALYIHKYGKKTKLSDIINKNYQLKTKFTKWKQNFDPVLRGLDDTFLIFLPGGKAGGQGAFDDKNIAVDYYFSRMNSEEQPLSDSNETYYKPIPDNRIPPTDDKSKLKNIRTLKKVKDKKVKIIKEKRIQIPLNPDNILKIDVSVKDGNNVNVIFRNVKKPEHDKFEVYLNSYMNVMKDMIEHDNKGLQQYHWLGSTVDIQSAIDKLLQLTEALQINEELHYSDFELIKYILFVYQTSNKIIKDDAEPDIQRSQNKQDEIVKSSLRAVSNRVGGNIDQSVKTLRKIYEDIKEIQEMSVTMSGTALEEFENFLLDLQSSLNKLHEAVKEIATITTFKKQNWFHDLKHLYLLPVEREVSLNLLLHLATSKLFGVIEDGAKNGIEDNFIIFVQNHREEVERTREDFIFVLRLLRAIKKAES
ncbi:hypothetical protein RR48_04574 [Papilio machaon]|uniref:Uncharacterized protein n=1 Tax=Papilio machaon TaxID=76193 RepID=A0A0N1INX0_PAPMA|nr:hypothetical protein RR48_04574 [Papilio machaon]